MFTRHRSIRSVLPLLAGFLLLGSSLSATSMGQDADSDAAETETTTGLVDFLTDVYPIFESKCLECHGPDEAKNDFRIDDRDAVSDYVESGDLESSSLWADYIATDDPDMKMPPQDSSQLTGPELATIKTWIEEGAAWKEPKADAPEETIAEDPAVVIPLAERALRFSGLFHPASVHFPIALLSISALFVLLSFFWREAFESAAYYCLLIGVLGAIAASVLGWGYALHEGYSMDYSLDKSIDRHRWLGIAVAAVGIVVLPMARYVRRKNDMGMRVLWLLGSLVLLGGVSTVGYQGGELTYGEDHYQKEFERMFPEYASPAEPQIDASESVEEVEADPAEADQEEVAEPEGDASISADA